MLDTERYLLLQKSLLDPNVQQRYRSFIHPAPTQTGCLIWTGAITGRGQGRFWVARRPDGRDLVIIAHRFGYALVHGLDALAETPVVRHVCDEPSCQTPQHWQAGTVQDNTIEWANRRHTIGSPLRDTRGARQRAEALRAAALTGEDLDAAVANGTPDGDRWQPPLFREEPPPGPTIGKRRVRRHTVARKPTQTDLSVPIDRMSS